MFLRDDLRVSWIQRILIEKSDIVIVFINDMMRIVSANDLAKDTRDLVGSSVVRHEVYDQKATTSASELGQ